MADQHVNHPHADRQERRSGVWPWPRPKTLGVFLAACVLLAAAGLNPAAAQVQWSYTFQPNNQALAHYPGDVLIDGLLTAPNFAIPPASFASPPPIGSTTPNSGAFTSLSSTGPVTGAGFSAYLASPPPIGGTAPAAGAFTTVAASGAITPAPGPGIVGTVAVGNANAGSVGELLSQNVVSPGGALTTAVSANVATLSLTAGDWDCSGVAAYAVSVGMTAAFQGINTTSATLPGSNGGGLSVFGLVGQNFSTGVTFPIGPTRVNVASTTNVFLVAQAAFASGTVSAYGFIRCRRVR